MAYALPGNATFSCAHKSGPEVLNRNLPLAFFQFVSQSDYDDWHDFVGNKLSVSTGYLCTLKYTPSGAGDDAAFTNTLISFEITPPNPWSNSGTFLHHGHPHDIYPYPGKDNFGYILTAKTHDAFPFSNGDVYLPVNGVTTSSWADPVTTHGGEEIYRDILIDIKYVLLNDGSPVFPPVAIGDVFTFPVAIKWTASSTLVHASGWFPSETATTQLNLTKTASATITSSQYFSPFCIYPEIPGQVNMGGISVSDFPVAGATSLGEKSFTVVFFQGCLLGGSYPNIIPKYRIIPMGGNSPDPVNGLLPVITSSLSTSRAAAVQILRMEPDGNISPFDMTNGGYSVLDHPSENVPMSKTNPPPSIAPTMGDDIDINRIRLVARYYRLPGDNVIEPGPVRAALKFVFTLP